MGEITYALVHRGNSGAYQVSGLGRCLISSEQQVRALYAHAAERVSQLLGMAGSAEQVHIIDVYKAKDPSIVFSGQSKQEVSEQLGQIDEFLYSKAISSFPEDLVSSLESDRGQDRILIEFVIRQKRALSEPVEDVFDRLKRARTVTMAPSETAKPAIYQHLQQEFSEKILDDRPVPDAGIPPIPLLYRGFGHFLDIMDGRGDVPGLVDIKVRELREAVDDFAMKMTEYFSKEDDRRDAALPYLGRIFSARRGIQIPSLHASAVGSEGHNIAAHGAGTMVVVFKNWSAALPQVEAACCAARLIASGTDENETRRQLYLRWRIPCLGLTIVGYDVTFYAIIAIDHRFRLISLAPTFSCIQLASDGRDRAFLYSAFTAASVLQAHILQDSMSLMNNLPATPAIPARARAFPAVSRLPKYPPSPNSYLTFNIAALFPDRQPYRLMYIAELPGIERKLILVKFARRYSIELHHFCAKSGHAPPILAFERLPGGWCAVAMEYIEHGVPITHSDLLHVHRDRWTDELRCLVTDFHKEGFVHGDLRDANIICKDDSVMLIDFDWGGEDGEVFYPVTNLNKELEEGRASGDDLRITKENDRRVLEKTLAKLVI